MSLTFQTVAGEGSSGTGTASFSNSVNAAQVAVQGFKFDYGADTDQYIDSINITVSNVQVIPANNQVTFSWEANMVSEDDTTTSGSRTKVVFLVIADVAAA